MVQELAKAFWSRLMRVSNKIVKGRGEIFATTDDGIFSWKIYVPSNVESLSEEDLYLANELTDEEFRLLVLNEIKDRMSQIKSKCDSIIKSIEAEGV